MVNEFKLNVIHVHAQTRCRSVHDRGFAAGQKTVENPGLGRGPPGQAFGLAGRSRAVGCGPRVCFLQNPSNTAAAWLDLKLAGESDSELNSECTIHSRLTLN